MTKNNELNYDSAYAELQSIINQIQDDNIEIEILSSLIKRANELKKYCESRLRSIEEDIKQSNI
jgi:exodeoxyribonuclease VII small subunit